MPRKPRLLLVGHSYHARTGSSAFLLPLLARRFEVEQLHDDSWQPGGVPLNAEAINARAPERVLFWQQLPRRAELRRLHCRNLTWAPMHDGIDYRGRGWRKLAASGIKLLAFSQVVQDHFGALGYDVHRARYYPEAGSQPALPTPDQAPALFFWTRRSNIDWPLLKRLLGAQRPSRILLRHAPDPGEVPARPDAADIADYRIELIEGWLASEDYARLLGACQLFMAPRALEGIGMASLEAMSRGMAVIAPNAPTMNEYLRHGDTGFLYELADPRPIDLANATAIGARARQAVLTGRQAWEAGVETMLDFIDGPARRPPHWSWRLRSALRL